MLNALRSIALLAVLVVLSGFLTTRALAQQSQYADAWTVNNNPDWTPSPPNSNPLGSPDGNCTGGTNTNGYAEFTFLGLGIPGGDVVLGIELNINYRSHTTPNMVELRMGGAVGSKVLPTGGTQSSCSNSALVTVGGATDLWGRP